MDEINYMRVAAAFGGSIKALTPKRNRTGADEDPGMVLKIGLDDGGVVTLEDNVSGVIDGLLGRLEELEDE